MPLWTRPISLQLWMSRPGFLVRLWIPSEKVRLIFINIWLDNDPRLLAAFDYQFGALSNRDNEFMKAYLGLMFVPSWSHPSCSQPNFPKVWYPRLSPKICTFYPNHLPRMVASVKVQIFPCTESGPRTTYWKACEYRHPSACRIESRCSPPGERK